MKVIDLLNKIANGEIEDKRTFNIDFKNGLYRSIYYDKDEQNCMCCLKNVSDDYSIYDDISFDMEIATIEEEKKIPEKIKDKYCSQISKVELAQKYNEIIDYLDYLKSKGE